jgi:hypothetical protein
MSATDDLHQLLQQLESDSALQASFRAHPGAAIENFEITAHERDAIVTRDLDDFVALGVVSSIWDLPEVLTGPRPSGLDLLRLRLAKALELLMSLPRRIRIGRDVIRVPRPRPKPEPRPRPAPGPRPGPRPGPGPDPPPGD